jgi:UDP-N-acetylmuramate--alanine ligase
MSGLATTAACLGARVTGSDRSTPEVLQRLREHGVAVTVGHSPDNVPADAELVYSSAVRADNVERARARELGLREIRRGELLAEVSRLRRCVAVAGTHGKTTTSAMVLHGLRAAGVEAGHVIGADLRDGTPRARWSSGEWLVVETDESDRTFLALEPELGVVTNIAREHTKEYRTLSELQDAFARFLASAQQTVIPDSPEIRRLCVTEPTAVFEAREVRVDAEGSTFTWRGHEVRLNLLGEHNVWNAAAALEALALMGVDAAAAVGALTSFPGPRRRLEPLGQTLSGALVYEDFAHHANEVRAGLAALRTLGRGRVIAVFEPLLFTRIRVMAAELGEALAAADVVLVLELYAGSEAGRYPPVSGQVVAEAVVAHAQGRPVVWEPDEERALEYLVSTLGAGDMCVFMGVTATPQRLARALLRPAQSRRA